MHHEKRVVILIGILSGICISLGFIRPFDGVIRTGITIKWIQR